MSARVCRVLSIVTFAVMVSAVSAWAAPRGRVYVRVGPPAPIVEVRAVQPGQRHMWVAGYHRWDGRAYVWVPGAWALPPRPHAVWVAPHWAHDRRGWYFVEGHWR
jgi:YXWGXW repeat-containing protein